MEASTSFAFFSHFKRVLPLIFAKSKISSSLPRRGFRCYDLDGVLRRGFVHFLFIRCHFYASIQFMPMFFLTCAKKSTPLTIAL